MAKRRRGRAGSARRNWQAQPALQKTQKDQNFLERPGAKEVQGVDIQIEREVYYCPVSRALMKRLQDRARTEGVSTETLVNLYLQEKLT